MCNIIGFASNMIYYVQALCELRKCYFLYVTRSIISSLCRKFNTHIRTVIFCIHNKMYWQSLLDKRKHSQAKIKL